MAHRQMSRDDSPAHVRTVRPVRIERRQRNTEQMEAAGRAHHGYSKAKAERLFEQVAATARQPLGKLRAQLIPDSSWRRGGSKLGPQASEAAARLSRILAYAEQVWGNQADATEWLNRPHPELDGATPYSMLRTEWGARAVQDLLAALEYGFPV